MKTKQPRQIKSKTLDEKKRDADLLDSLSQWRDEFQKQCHPVTLTLNRAISRIVEIIK